MSMDPWGVNRWRGLIRGNLFFVHLMATEITAQLVLISHNEKVERIEWL